MTKEIITLEDDIEMGDEGENEGEGDDEEGESPDAPVEEEGEEM